MKFNGHWMKLWAWSPWTNGRPKMLLKKIVVKYEKLPHLVNERDLSKAAIARSLQPSRRQAIPTRGFRKLRLLIEGEYGIPIITHCCLEPHGQIVEWENDQLTVHPSTQNVTGLIGQFAQPLQIPAANVKIRMDYIGGGFGSKFGADSWGLESAHLSKQAGWQAGQDLS